MKIVDRPPISPALVGGLSDLDLPGGAGPPKFRSDDLLNNDMAGSSGSLLHEDSRSAADFTRACGRPFRSEPARWGGAAEIPIGRFAEQRHGGLLGLSAS